jgi:hypothetical protein
MWIIQRTAAIDEEEAELALALVAMVDRAQPTVSVTQVTNYLISHFQVVEHEVQVCRSRMDDFLLIFIEQATTNQMLESCIGRGVE